MPSLTWMQYLSLSATQHCRSRLHVHIALKSGRGRRGGGRRGGPKKWGWEWLGVDSGTFINNPRGGDSLRWANSGQDGLETSDPLPRWVWDVALASRGGVVEIKNMQMCDCNPPPTFHGPQKCGCRGDHCTWVGPEATTVVACVPHHLTPWHLPRQEGFEAQGRRGGDGGQEGGVRGDTLVHLLGAGQQLEAAGGAHGADAQALLAQLEGRQGRGVVELLVGGRPRGPTHTHTHNHPNIINSATTITAAVTCSRRVGLLRKKMPTPHVLLTGLANAANFSVVSQRTGLSPPQGRRGGEDAAGLPDGTTQSQLGEDTRGGRESSVETNVPEGDGDEWGRWSVKARGGRTRWRWLSRLPLCALNPLRCGLLRDGTTQHLDLNPSLCPQLRILINPKVPTTTTTTGAMAYRRGCVWDRGAGARGGPGLAAGLEGDVDHVIGPLVALALLHRLQEVRPWVGGRGGRGRGATDSRSSPGAEVS